MATCLLPNGVGGIGLRRSTIPKLQRLPFPSKNLVGSRQKPGVVRAGLGELVHGLFVGVGVGLPCTVMECGDIIYRSTLPRSNGLTITAPGVLLGMAAVSYLWSTPGVAPGFFDMFVLAFVERLFRPTYRKYWGRNSVRGHLEWSTKFPRQRNLQERYAAPEQYIMSTQTPSAPSAPVATALSPVLWQLNLPDRFDIYSAGLIFLQMAVPSLRTDSSLIQFNRQLKRCNYDLAAWRKSVVPRASPDLRRGYELLDLDGGMGWELLTSMVRYKARQRISAKGALAHPYFNQEALLGLSFMQNFRLQLLRATQQDYSEAAKWIINLMAKSGTEKEGGFTEAQLQEIREIQPRKKAGAQRNALASVLRLQRKIIKTLNESMDELNRRRKSLWWSRWIPREE